MVLKQATRVRDFEFNISIATIVYCNHSDPGYYESKRSSKALLQNDLLSPKSFDVWARHSGIALSLFYNKISTVK